MPDLARETELAIAASRSFRKMADRLMDHAHDQLTAGRLGLDDYYTVSDRYQSLVQQANLITYEADRLVGQGVQAEFAGLVDVTRDLEGRFQRLRRIEHIMALSMKLFVAVGSVVLAVVNPGLGTIAAALAAVGDAGVAVVAEDATP